MSKKTVLNANHRALGAHMVDFGGWDMPVNYGSQIEEHHAVRRAAGMFDVSHMRAVDLRGERVREFLRHLLANDVAKLTTGQALYGCMLNAQGGVIDDLIVYDLGPAFFRAVVNAATTDSDLAWINAQAEPFAVSVRARPDLAMIAVQGPRARDSVLQLLDANERARIAALERFHAAHAIGLGSELFIARTGYTGEDGFEIMVPDTHAVTLWDALLAKGVKPAGLGARDTLRLEAGMNLSGQDMGPDVSPWEAGLGWTVAMRDAQRNFVGRVALEAQKAAGVTRRMVGLVLDGKGVLRHGQKVVTGAGEGVVLSGVFAPTLGKAIAFARVPAGELGEVTVDIRGRAVTVRVVKYPFVRDGKPQPGI